ncbi:MAG: right-handed parallel beta-helix repeat-containing protein [Deltaproteobacteria bacterium]|nr:right-handed parallel beta-helix repeat-containing protein [Deltaproteobacteria bacterium]
MWLAAVLAAGCTKDNTAAFCAAHPEDPGCPDAAPACVQDQQCGAGATVCDQASGTCVQCLPERAEGCPGATPACDPATRTCVQCSAPGQVDACVGATPVCGEDHVCRACVKHAECSSSVCLADGTCADETKVAYVASTGSGSACTRTAPCSTLAAALVRNQPIVKFDAGIVKDTQLTLVIGRTLLFVAEAGAQLTREGTGPLLELQNSDVTIFDLEITGQMGTNDAVIHALANPTPSRLALERARVAGNQGTAIRVSLGSILVLEDSTIANNGAGVLLGGSSASITRSTIDKNAAVGVDASDSIVTISESTLTSNSLGAQITGGRITLARSMVARNRTAMRLQLGEFDLSNNYIIANGGSSSLFGGIAISQPPGSGVRRIEFNTISGNRGVGSTTGVSCADVAQPITFSNNIVFNNDSVVIGGNPVQVSGANCLWTFSNIGPQFVNGTGNINVDPQFVDVTSGDLHLKSTSPCMDAANPNANVPDDFDGDPRPQGAAHDIGADEVKP